MLHLPQDFDRLRLLTEGSRRITDAGSLEEVLEATVAGAASLFGAERSLLALMDREEVLEARAGFGIEAAQEVFREPLDAPLSERLAAALGAPEVLAVPLVIGGRVGGILAVGCAASVEHEDLQEWMLSALADQAAIALERADSSRGVTVRERLMGIVGHDLRTPLQAIRLAAGALLRRGEVAEPDLRLVRRIADSADRMSAIVGQLLDFTALRLGGGLSLSRQTIDLGRALRAAVDELVVARPESTIELAEPEEAVVGRWDRGRLGQALANLLTNAIEHGDPPGYARIRTTRAAGEVAVSVWNPGGPIPPPILATLFDPFQKTASSQEGSRHLGLGLYIASEIACAHGGHIAVDSSATAGTTFTLVLPVAAA